MNAHQLSFTKHILSGFKNRKNIDPKEPQKAEAKRNGVINSQNYNFNQFLYGQFWCSQNGTNQPNSTIELGY